MNISNKYPNYSIKLRRKAKISPPETAFVLTLLFILLGYMYLGKGFAYLHIPIGFPLYVGEIVLGFGLLAAALRPGMLINALSTTPGKIYACFFTWGMIRTLPYINRFGITAGRDSALYYYGIFMLLVYGVIRKRRQIIRITVLYAKPASLYVFWVPVAFFLYNFARDYLPRIPGTDLSILIFKYDIVIHLTGAIAFFALFSGVFTKKKVRKRNVLWYILAVLSCILMMGRSSYLTLICGFTVMVFLNGIKKSIRPLAGFILAITLLFLIIPNITSPYLMSEISPEVVVGLTKSIFTDVDDPRFRQGTKVWRLMWWKMIIDETVFGPYFWTGRGFGENLADVHGFLSSDPEKLVRPLRSPHNSHMTVLSRMGVPGFLLWIIFHAVLVKRFYSGWRRARRAGDRFLQGVFAWVLCFWVAFMVNSMFDMTFEGPHGAIWFWSVMGLGLAVNKKSIRNSESDVKST